MLNAQGSRPLDLYGWRRIGRFYLQSAVSTQAIAATTTSTVNSTGLVLRWGLNQAIYIRRYACGVNVSVADSNFILYFAGSLEVQAGVQPFTISSGQVANYSDILPATPSAAAPNAQTLSQVSAAVTLVDDWHEFNDYQELAKPGVGGAGLGLQSFFRLRNTDAAAHSASMVDSVLYEIWQSAGLQGSDLP